MSKANKDGWIRNRGKEPDLPRSTVVEVRLRDRSRLFNTGATVEDYFWSIIGDVTDIMAYRVVESQEDVKTNNTQKAHCIFVAIDAEKNVMAIDQIKDSILGDLFDEGFQLETTEIVNITTGEKKKLLDLSHLRAWK